MKKREIKVINRSDNQLPEYKTPLSAGMDIRAYIPESEEVERVVRLEPFQRRLIHTGLYVQLPPDLEMQVRSRSGMALNNGVTVLNSPGTVDADYRGEIGVILINLSNEPFEIKSGDRIAQLVVKPYLQVEMKPVDELDVTERKGGFCSTGMQ